MNVIQNLPRKDYRPQHCDNGINNLLARERWHHHKVARLGWISCLLAGLAVLYLFILAAHADEFGLDVPDPDLGFDWLPWLAWSIVALVAAFMIWQVKCSLPIILNRADHDDSPEDRLGGNWKHFNDKK